MSRHMMDRAVVTALCFLSTLAISGTASAGPPQRGGAPAAMPHPAAAAPHFSAPAPHFAAPAPHVAAPAPHFSAPARIAAPHYAAPPARTFSAPPRSFAAQPVPHYTAPHRAYAEMPRGHAPQVQAQRFAPTPRQAAIARTQHELNRTASKPAEITKQATVGPKTGPADKAVTSKIGPADKAVTSKIGPADKAVTSKIGPAEKAVTSKTGPTENKVGATDNRIRPGQTTPGQTTTGQTTTGQTTKGQPVTGAKTGAGQTATLTPQNQGQKLALADAARARVEEAKKTPILKNPVFAAQSPRAVGATLANWTFRGHFAQSAFFPDRFRHHHHFVFIVLGFVGPIFWPYAYDDFVDYTFAPYAYDTFWPYAFDDVYAGIYGGYAPEYYAPVDAYAYAGSPGSARAYSRASRQYTTRANAPAGGGAAARVCSGEAQGLTDFSIQKIADQVQPTQDQQALLDDLKAATLQAVQILQAACPTELPSTATGRLAAMRARVEAMLEAVNTVAPALDRFYQSLNDEQRARFNAMDRGEQQAAQAKPSDLDRLCKGQDSVQARLPIDRIQRTLRLSPAQEDGLKALDDATIKASEILRSQCQPGETLTPTGRLAAMRDRLTAMSKALEVTQAALTKFYGSLSDEQKAQFDRINARQA